MHRVKSVKSVDLFPAVIELLKNDRKVRITVTGNSMLPFLRENKDSVELCRASFKDLRFGQIILIRRGNGQYILHRLILKRKDCFYMAGDAQCWFEGPLSPDQLLAVVTMVWRNDRPVSPCSPLWRILVLLWSLRLLVRYALVKPYKILRKFFKNLLKHYSGNTGG